jgi:hypothetical protein
MRRGMGIKYLFEGFEELKNLKIAERMGIFEDLKIWDLKIFPIQD